MQVVTAWPITELASRSFAPRLRDLIESGYQFHLVFLWLPSAAAAVARVAERVRLGGHDVPVATVRRRYKAGLKNFFELYRPLSTTWQVIDNSRRGKPKLVAPGSGATTTVVKERAVWQQVCEGANHG